MTTDNTQSTAPAAKQLPQYRLREKSYIGERLHEEGSLVYWKGRPEAHMEPVNAAAKEACEKYKAYLEGCGDPIQGMSVINKQAVDDTKKALGA